LQQGLVQQTVRLFIRNGNQFNKITIFFTVYSGEVHYKSYHQFKPSDQFRQGSTNRNRSELNNRFDYVRLL